MKFTFPSRLTSSFQRLSPAFPFSRTTWLLLAASSSVLADEPRLDPAHDLLQQQQGQSLQRRLETPPTPIEHSAAPTGEEGGACVDVSAVVVDGADHLPSSRRDAITRTFIDRCLTRGDINLLLQTVNQAYQEAGYITTRAYLPEQHVQNGVLHIKVVEGVIEDLRLNDNRHASDRRRVAAAFPAKPGSLLQLADIEQGMDQLNRAPSAAATAMMSPGAAPGRTVLDIKTRDDRTWRAGLSTDNGGERSTGRTRLQATLDKDNLLEVNDVWSLALSRTKDSRALSLSTLVPMGYWTGAFGYSTSDYGADLTGGVRLTGNSHSTVLGLERLFYRNHENQWSVIAQLANRESRRAINNADLLPDIVTTVRAGGRWLRRDDHQSGYVELDWVRGKGWLDATADHNLPTAAPHHQFNKMELTGQWRRLLPADWEWSTQFRLQYARVGLVGAEQLILGGNDSLRGFDAAVAYGDQGLSLRNQWSRGCLSSAFGEGWRCLVFSDVGMTRNLQAPPIQRLWSGGSGLR